ncbi:hypothetical protein KY289_017837 [Solanum tuberosum]|nr:hypothetical protein KY289_017837 [Solanum tuberosum]
MDTIASPHFVIFPFMAHGHTIPLLHLATLLRHVSSPSPSSPPPLTPPPSAIFYKTHPFPLSNSLFLRPTKLMQPLFEQALSALQHSPTCVISDAFLGWTQESAKKIGVPMYFFSGMSVFATIIGQLLGIERAETISADESFTFSGFPWLKFTRNDFPPPFGDLEPKGPAVDFWIELGISIAKSRGMITNSFYELEPRFADYFNQHLGPKSWLEERVKNRALIVKEWVDQNQVLNHKSIKGFLSHCGWNSILESICAKVPILALPFMAEQHVNTRMVTEEIGVGLRIMPRNGSVRGFVEAEEVEKMVRELMEGEKGEMVRKKVKELGENAEEAMKEGGSSWSTLDLLIDDACARKL